MTKRACRSKPQQPGPAKIIPLDRSRRPGTPAKPAPADDPRRNYFARSNGSRWGRELRRT